MMTNLLIFFYLEIHFLIQWQKYFLLCFLLEVLVFTVRPMICLS